MASTSDVTNQENQTDRFPLLMEHAEWRQSNEHLIDIEGSSPPSSSPPLDNEFHGSNRGHDDAGPSASSVAPAIQSPSSTSNSSHLIGSSVARKGDGSVRRHLWNTLNTTFWIAIEMLFTLGQIVAAVVVLSVSRHENPLLQLLLFYQCLDMKTHKPLCSLGLWIMRLVVWRPCHSFIGAIFIEIKFLHLLHFVKVLLNMRDMAVKMAAKYDKYWEECDLLLSFSSILDPRYKKGMIRFAYESMYPIDHEDRVETVEKYFNDLYDQYAKIYGDEKGKDPESYSTYLKQPPSSTVECSIKESLKLI